MENQKKEFEAGKIIKGSDLKECTLCKILSRNMVMRRFQYQIGMNEDVKPFDISGRCDYGLHFSLVQDILYCLDYGTQLAVVDIPDGEDVYVDETEFRAHRLVIERVMPLKEISAWEYLLGHGADIMSDKNYAVRYAAQNGYMEVVRYLHENGADITAEDNYAVRRAAERGHLEVVKYLYGHGADITARRNYALRWSATNGHLEVAGFLREHMR